MKTTPFYIILFLLTSLVTHAQEYVRTSRGDTLLQVPAGQALRIQTLRRIGSETLKQGDTLTIETLDEVRYAGRLLIAKGARGVAQVARVKRKSPLGKGGELAITPINITGYDNALIPLIGDTLKTEGKSNKILSIGLITAGSCLLVGGILALNSDGTAAQRTSLVTLCLALGVPATALGYFTKGDRAVINKGANIGAKTAGPVLVPR